MAAKKYIIKLGKKEKEYLEKYIKKGKRSARAINRARVLLSANEQKKDEEIANILGLSKPTIYRVREKYYNVKENHPHKKFSAEKLNLILEERPRSGQPIKVDAKVESNITMIACSNPPKGEAKWTMKLIADKLVELQVVDSISRESVRKSLKKTNLNPGLKNNGV